VAKFVFTIKKEKEKRERMFMGLKERGVPLICLQRAESPCCAL
jgi:hypothetical protein